MRVGIVGLGVLGSSLGLGLRAHKGWEDVTGFDTSARVQNAAKHQGAIREGTSDIPDLLSDADIVVLAVPPLAVLDILREHGHRLRTGCVVTDLAASKEAIMAAAGRYVPARSGFVGGHPLVSAPPGGEHGRATLFRGRSWCLTATEVAEERMAAVIAMVEAADAIPYFVDAAEHDAWIAGVEGLPRIMAAALARIANDSAAWRELARITGMPFEVATAALATSQPEGRDLALTAGTALVSWLDRLQVELTEWREAIAESRGEELAQRFGGAATARERWDKERTRQSGERPLP